MWLLLEDGGALLLSGVGFEVGLVLSPHPAPDDSCVVTRAAESRAVTRVAESRTVTRQTENRTVSRVATPRTVSRAAESRTT